MKFIECPRDAMQGIGTFIPTYKKISYINKLLQVGFDTIDVGSFVSKNAIPQMVDTEEVIKGINIAYFSMAFGNPYGDEWSVYIVAHWAERLLNEFGVKILSLSDTIGSSEPNVISWLFKKLISEFPDVEFGAHLHTHPQNWKEKVIAALEAGCKRFDGALLGFGGCPMARDELVGNMPSEHILQYLMEKKMIININQTALQEAQNEALTIFI